MPYGCFQVVCIVAMIGFTVLSYDANLQDRQTEIIVYAGLALLFQPFTKVVLGLQIWNIMDVMVATRLVASIYFGKKEAQQKHYVAILARYSAYKA